LRAMSGISLLLLAALSIAAIPAARAGTGQAGDMIADVIARVQPSVVRIVVVHSPAKSSEGETKLAGAADTGEVTNIGSGFAISSAGLVATNRHVVENAISIFVVTADGGRYRAETVGMAAKADIALLRIGENAHLPGLTFGDSDKLRAGDTVVAIGSPFGFDNTVTAGIVSSINRDIMESPFDNYIQTDAAINHGNSGGPLFNMAGQVVGMNSVLFAPGTGSVGVGFAIPSNDLRFVFDRLEKYGDVRGGMLPIRAQQVTGLMAEALGIPAPGGALIAAVDPAADPMKGKIEPGDVITRFNNQPVADPRDLARKAAWVPVGETVELALYRDGKVMSVKVAVMPLGGMMPPATANGHHPKSLGLQFTDIPDGRPDQGVTLTDVDPSGSAADSGLRKGDIIMRVQQQVISSSYQASKALQSRVDAKQAYAALLVKRDDKQTWMPVALPE
jgi:serine protease Do